MANINTDKLEFFPRFNEAKTIVMQSSVGAKMYPTSKENIIKLVKLGRFDESKLKQYFTPESIAAAKKPKQSNSKKDNNQNESKN